MRRTLARWAEMLGKSGIVGIGLAMFCAAFYAGTLRPAEQRLAELHLEQARLERVAQQRARQNRGDSGGSLEERLRGFYALLATEQSVGELLESIDAAARRNGVLLRQGNYRYHRESGWRAGRYEVSYTGQTQYPRARIFLDEVLRELPMLSLDEVSFQRQQASSGVTELTARFSVFVRRES